MDDIGEMSGPAAGGVGLPGGPLAGSALPRPATRRPAGARPGTDQAGLDADPQTDADTLAFAVTAARDGDEAAFRLLYRACQPRLVRYLRVLVGEDAEDVASEVWLQVARDLRTFQGDFDGFRGWVATIGRHRALDELRRRRRRPPADLPVSLLAELAGGEDTAGQAMEAMSTDAALALIATLPRDQAEAVVLRVVMGLDAQAAGRVLGKRAGAVRTASHRGLRALATRLEQVEREQQRQQQRQRRAGGTRPGDAGGSAHGRGRFGRAGGGTDGAR